jgi:hypothetical protein
MRRKSNKLIWIVAIGAAVFFFKDKLIALFQSITGGASAAPATGVAPVATPLK